MILLDENVDVLVRRRRLRDWRIRFKHIGTSIGRRGMKDVDEILPLLHRLDGTRRTRHFRRHQVLGTEQIPPDKNAVVIYPGPDNVLELAAAG